MDRGDGGYRPETGCAAQADVRGDSLLATAPPAERWLLIESHAPWPRQALTALHRGPAETARQVGRPGLAEVVGRMCRELGIRPVLVRRYGRVDRTRGRRWGLVDCRPGREVVRWGPLLQPPLANPPRIYQRPHLRRRVSTPRHRQRPADLRGLLPHPDPPLRTPHPDHHLIRPLLRGRPDQSIRSGHLQARSIGRSVRWAA